MTNVGLFEAVVANDIEGVTRLLDAGAHPDLGDKEGNSSLAWAAGSGYTEIVKLLLERGANTEITNRYEVRPIQHASNAGHSEIVRLLVDHGARFYSPEARLNPLIGAASNGRLAVVRYLVEVKGVPVNDRDPEGGTALHSAAVNGHVSVVEYLLQHGADPSVTNIHGNNVISWVEAAMKLSGRTAETTQAHQRILQLLRSARGMTV